MSINNKNKPVLGVNVDHVATIRQQRHTVYPCPLEAALIAEEAGASGITAHLREDRRHIQDADIFLLQERINTRLNLEMAASDEMIAIALKVKPAHCCLVPEKREELTTEGGLDVAGQFERIYKCCQVLGDADIRVSLFIEPSEQQIEASIKAGAPDIELHTGHYAEAVDDNSSMKILEKIKQAVNFGVNEGLRVNAGHGLHLANTKAIASIPGIFELNIGHSIIARSLMVGMHEAVREMLEIMN